MCNIKLVTSMHNYPLFIIYKVILQKKVCMYEFSIRARNTFKYSSKCVLVSAVLF